MAQSFLSKLFRRNSGPDSVFPALKAEILRRAKEAGACEKEYRRAYAAESLRGLLEVVKETSSGRQDTK